MIEKLRLPTYIFSLGRGIPCLIHLTPLLEVDPRPRALARLVILHRPKRAGVHSNRKEGGVPCARIAGLLASLVPQCHEPVGLPPSFRLITKLALAIRIRTWRPGPPHGFQILLPDAYSFVPTAQVRSHASRRSPPYPSSTAPNRRAHNSLCTPSGNTANTWSIGQPPSRSGAAYRRFHLISSGIEAP